MTTADEYPAAQLVLADGTRFRGQLFGSQEQASGEVVFNTSMTGYSEILTDPSYAGQIVTLTYPLIGNYGVASEDFQSRACRVRGLVVSEWCPSPSHWQNEKTVDDYLREQGIAGLTGIDTRRLTRHLRLHGTIAGVITTDMKLDHWPGISIPTASTELVPQVSTTSAYELAPLKERPWSPKVAVLDFGVKNNITDNLRRRGCRVTVLPYDTPVQDVLDLEADGLVISNGPGDPAALKRSATRIRQIVETGLPTFGICLGHQLLALALGARTYKLKFGHRGANHPVKHLDSQRVYITSQNHGYAVDGDTLPDELRVTAMNLNDQTVEGLEHRSLPVFSVQYHPEAGPGPQEPGALFDDFYRSMKKRTSSTKDDQHVTA